MLPTPGAVEGMERMVWAIQEQSPTRCMREPGSASPGGSLTLSAKPIGYITPLNLAAGRAEMIQAGRGSRTRLRRLSRPQDAA